ncbi:MAG: hypothetical protein IPP84_05295 [Propionivibrio sp.]|nr:hypothetical protein [Propionivibrio sp.]
MADRPTDVPDFKTIADFRKDNGKAIRRVCRQFVVVQGARAWPVLQRWSRSMGKFLQLSIIGTEITSAKLQRGMKEIEASISRHLSDPTPLIGRNLLLPRSGPNG